MLRLSISYIKATLRTEKTKRNQKFGAQRKMKIGIIGLPSSGKTTIFNSLTHGNAEVGGFGTPQSANIGVAHVPDERVDILVDLFNSKKSVNYQSNF